MDIILLSLKLKPEQCLHSKHIQTALNKREHTDLKWPCSINPGYIHVLVMNEGHWVLYRDIRECGSNFLCGDDRHFWIKFFFTHSNT